MDFLPEEILVEIFKLSGSCCYNCKFVCRKWFRINSEFNLPQLFEACLKEQNVSLMDKIPNVERVVCLNRALEICVQNGLFISLEWLLKKEEHLSRSIYPLAAKFNRLDVSKWASKKNISIQSPSQNPYRFALENQNFEMLDWLFNSQCPWEQQCYIPAIASNSVEILNWLEQKGIFNAREFERFPYTAIAPLTEIACGWKSFESLRWLFSRRMYISTQCSYLSSKSRDFQTLDWLKEKSLLDSDKAFTAAYQADDQETINHLQKLGLIPGNSTICVMIEKDLVEEVERTGILLDSIHFLYMLEYDRQEMMKILFKQNNGKIPEDCLKILIQKKRWDILNWAIREGNVTVEEIKILTCKLSRNSVK